MDDATGPPDLDEAALAAARAVLAGARRVVVLTGAGISTDSGIPDFRGPNGLWTKNPEAEKLATIDHYLADPATRKRSWRWRIESGLIGREPNAGHLALVELERQGRLDLLVTQNVDGLHHAAGHDPDRVVEVHGTVRDAVCVSCRWRGPIGPVIERVRAGEDDPPCEVCGGILKTATVMFGENLDPGDLERAFVAAGACDVFVAVGTSLAVYPIADTVPTALRAGAALVVVNAEPTPYDAHAAAVVRGSISDVLPRLVARD